MEGSLYKIHDDDITHWLIWKMFFDIACLCEGVIWNLSYAKQLHSFLIFDNKEKITFIWGMSMAFYRLLYFLNEWLCVCVMCV